MFLHANQNLLIFALPHQIALCVFAPYLHSELISQSAFVAPIIRFSHIKSVLLVIKNPKLISHMSVY